MPLNNLPGNTYLSANAFALLPYESMATKHAARQQELGYGMMLLQSMQQQAQQVQQSEQERSQLFNTIATADILPPDKVRIKALTDGFREKMQDIIKNEYKGDGRRFERERQAVLLNEFRQELANSPLLAKAHQNKQNFILYQSAKAKGMMVMPTLFMKDEKGAISSFLPYENLLRDYFRGAVDTIDAPEVFEFPKDVLEKFGKEYKAGAQYGEYNPQTKRFEAPPVTEKELYQAVTDKGYDPNKAYYITKFLLGNQVGQLRWKIDQQSPWQLEKQLHDMKMDLFNLGLRQRSENRHEREFQYRKQQDQQQQDKSRPMMGVFEAAMRVPNSGAFVAQKPIPAGQVFPSMPNPNGGNGFSGVRAILDNQQQKGVRDLFGFVDKAKTTNVGGVAIGSIGKVSEVISPNTGQNFVGNFAVTALGEEVVYTLDPRNPKQSRSFIRAKVAIDDDTAFEQNMKQSMGLWDASTSHFQGRHKKAIGGGGFWNDVDEYEVLIPLPNSGLGMYKMDKTVLPNKEAVPYIIQGLQQGRSEATQNLLRSLPK